MPAASAGAASNTVANTAAVKPPMKLRLMRRDLTRGPLISNPKGYCSFPGVTGVNRRNRSMDLYHAAQPKWVSIRPNRHIEPGPVDDTLEPEGSHGISGFALSGRLRHEFDTVHLRRIAANPPWSRIALHQALDGAHIISAAGTQRVGRDSFKAEAEFRRTYPVLASSSLFPETRDSAREAGVPGTEAPDDDRGRH